MTALLAGTTEFQLNECSIKTINEISRIISNEPLGTALILGKLAVLVLPLPKTLSTFDNFSIINIEYLCASRLPDLHHFGHLLNHTLDDAQCAVYTQQLVASKLEQIKFWDRWIVEYFCLSDEIQQLPKLINQMGKVDKLTLQDFNHAFIDN